MIFKVYILIIALFSFAIIFAFDKFVLKKMNKKYKIVHCVPTRVDLLSLLIVVLSIIPVVHLHMQVNFHELLAWNIITIFFPPVFAYLLVINTIIRIVYVNFHGLMKSKKDNQISIR